MISIKVDGFDWDVANRSKCEKHGLTVSEIQSFFKQDEIHIAPDIKHSGEETRYLAMGRTRKGRPIFVAFTFRYKGALKLIRPISARYMHSKEAKRYEQEKE